MAAWLLRSWSRPSLECNGHSLIAASVRKVLRACTLLPLIAPILTAQGEEPLAVFAGHPIYETELSPNAQAQLQTMMQQVWGVKRRALQSLLDRELVEAEARKKGVGAEDLLLAEVDSRIADPAEDAVRAYHQARQDLKNQPFEQVKETARQQLKNEEIQNARAAYVRKLMQQAVSDGEIVLLARPPKVEVRPDPARLRGDPQAAVTIVEFSDFSCPACRAAESALNTLLEKYQGRVKLAYRDFPLTQIHPQAQLAAEASRCAGEQDRYWEYHDLLFLNIDRQGRDDLLEHARALELDEKRFAACLGGGKYKLQVDRDIQLGTSSGVFATPAFFVNGVFLSGAQPANVFEKVIEQELSAAPKPAR